MINKNGKTVEKNNNFRLKFTLIMALTLLVTGLVSYGAFFVTKMQEDNNQITSTCFDQTFSEGTSISLTNALPLSDAAGLETDPYTFTITNNCNVNTMYYIILSTKNTNLPDSKIKFSYNGTNTALVSNSMNNTLYSKDAGYTNSYIIMDGTLSLNQSQTFDIRVWLDEAATYASNMSWQGQIRVVSTVAPNSTATLVKSDYTVDFGVDTSNANTPYLVDNLIPVIYDEANDQWVKTNTGQSNWYNYTTQTWANAVTTTAQTRALYNASDPGTIIPMTDIMGMYVWIPRYEYNYTNLGTSYAGGTQTAPGAIGNNYVSGVSTTETANYIIHPAFRNGSVTYTNNAYTTTAPYQMGGWDKELTGFWYGKFETGSQHDNISNNALTSDILIKPDVYALRNQSVSNEYLTSKNIASVHGITLDSHMSKNSEWGAVTYLTQSYYGKYGNANYTGANKEVYLNNSSFYKTGKSMGMPGGAAGYNVEAEGSYTYKDKLNGTGSSTTGNIYGIYDMSGGAYEYLMGSYNGYSGQDSSFNSGFSGLNGNGSTVNGIEFSSQKYYDKYTTSDAATACGGICYGHAFSETSGYYNDFKITPTSTSPWVIRGAQYVSYDSFNSGIFGYASYNGVGSTYNSFRVVLT